MSDDKTKAKQIKDKPAKVMVEWTKLGQEKGANSEYGEHAAGDVIETEHAEILIERGFAKAVT